MTQCKHIQSQAIAEILERTDNSIKIKFITDGNLDIESIIGTENILSIEDFNKYFVII